MELISKNWLAEGSIDRENKNGWYKEDKKIILKAKKNEKKDKVEKEITRY